MRKYTFPILDKKNIIDRQLPDWIAALQNQNAVYLITDNNTGKLYVSSATAQYGMLLKRWSNYIILVRG